LEEVMKKLPVFLLLVFFVCLLSGCGGGPSSSSSPPSLGNPPTVSASSTDPILNVDGTYSSTINWTTTNAIEVEIPPYPATFASSGSGSQVVNMLESTAYSVIARGPGGTSTYTVSISINKIPPNKPTAPSAAASVTGSGEITLSWSGSTIPGNPSAVIAYDVYMGGVLKNSSVVSPYVFIGLSNGYSYSFKVTAVYTNPGGTMFKTDSNIVTVVLGLDVYDVLVTVTWSLPTTYTDNTTIAPVDVVRIRCTLYANTTGVPSWGSPRVVSNEGATSGQFTMTVTEGQTYYFTATASLDNQVSNYSIPVVHSWGPVSSP
jgi:hypothetical protein